MRGRRLGILLPAATSACLLLVPIDDAALTDGSPGVTADGAPPPDAGDGDVPPSLPDGAPRDALDTNDGSDAGQCPEGDARLVAWFRFDESELPARDCSGRRLVASSIGAAAPKLVPGRIGNAIDFDGARTCLEVPLTEDFHFNAKPYTIAAWVHVREFTYPDNSGRFVAAYQPTRGWHFGTDNGLKFELDLQYGAGGDLKLQVQTILTPRKWAHVAATYTPGARASMYLNGDPSASEAPVPADLDAEPSKLRLGCRGPSSGNFDGLVDDLRIYDRVLPDGEIAALAR